MMLLFRKQNLLVIFWLGDWELFAALLTLQGFHRQKKKYQKPRALVYCHYEKKTSFLNEYKLYILIVFTLMSTHKENSICWSLFHCCWNCIILDKAGTKCITSLPSSLNIFYDILWCYLVLDGFASWIFKMLT